jgi:hypothetical protein
MRLTSAASRDQILISLQRASREAWGDERTEELDSALQSAARNAWTLLQYPLQPTDEEPDVVSDSLNVHAVGSSDATL